MSDQELTRIEDAVPADKTKRRRICVAFMSRFADLSERIAVVAGPLRVEQISHATVDPSRASVILVLSGPEDVVREHEKKIAGLTW